MKLLRVGAAGAEKPAMLDPEGKLRDLSGHVLDISGDTLSPRSLSMLRQFDPYSLPEMGSGRRIGPCIGQVGKIICVGLNYTDHAHELDMPLPDEPILFGKAVSSLSGPHDNVSMPRDATKLDYEVELAVVIGSRAKYVSRSQAMAHVAGYAVFNDLSERTFQTERGGQWIKGKSHDGFGPLGPWLVTTDEIADPQDLTLSLSVNGELRQRGSTQRMIFDVPTLISYISQFMTLEPGDIIPTGTPPGVAMGMHPQAWLQPGDLVEAEVQGLGQQAARIIPADVLAGVA
ncbi:MAG: fumarylacetoacetate hydrolase family protein [Pseudomonadota bacterium]